MSTPASVISSVDLATRFGTPDYIVFAGMLTVSAAIGIYYACSGSKQSTTKEFLMGDRSMSVFPVSISVLASFMSAITLLGTPAEVYQYGTQFWMICLCFFITMPLAAYCYLPVFYNLGVTSVYEYLEKRFSLTVRIIGSVIFVVETMMYLALVLYAPSLALFQVSGLSTYSISRKQKTIWINLLGGFIIITATCFAGLIIYSRYHECDPITAGLVNAPDQLLPLFMMDVLGYLPGLPGLFVSGVFSAALSTLSSAINSLAAVTLEDIIKTCIKKDVSELWAIRITKGLALLYGVITILLVAVVQLLGDILQAAWSFNGILGGPLLGLFTLGMFCPWANSKGAVSGLLCGLALSSWIGLGSFVYKPDAPKSPVSIGGCLTNVTLSPTYDPRHNENILVIYRLSYVWFTIISIFFVLFSGIIISLLTGKSDPGCMDPKLITPVFDTFCRWLPPSVLSKLGLPVGHKMSNVG
ncbi:sodium-coupled monocarboxylate transporter 1-like [Limulus polyphemus]|uniref:Sodium-coupled monocarboxylate transporter 1-like n=1 Tax=Limulus polyphemus TaxID=6850 RepID=A0ABM1T397_LIMPO|nr:sodium-coupled monocarboxylate transporter 1-like [Limulus polyphemus]